jgi:hypothetical protein
MATIVVEKTCNIAHSNSSFNLEIPVSERRVRELIIVLAPSQFTIDIARFCCHVDPNGIPIVEQKKDRPMVVTDSWSRSAGSMYNNSYYLDGTRIMDGLLGRDATRHGVQTLILLMYEEG